MRSFMALAGAVCFMAAWPQAAAAEVCAQPEGRPRTVFLGKYEFESGQIAGEELQNACDETGWLNGRIFGEPAEVSGSTGQALQFDGGDDYIEIPETANMSFRHGVRIEVKVKIDDRSGDGGIVAKWYGSDQWGLSAHPSWGAYGALDFTVRLDDGTPGGAYHTAWYAFSNASYVGTWITLKGVYDPALGLQLFVDGVVVATDPASGLPIIDGYVPVHVGDGGTDWSRFEGRIDDLEIWGDFTPAPRDVVRLVEYDFDQGQVVGREVDNLRIQSIPWMTGEIVGGRFDEESQQLVPDLAMGVTPDADDQSLRLNVPRPAEGEPWDYLEVIYGDYLAFHRGILVNTAIFFEQPFDKGVLQIATQLVGGSASRNHWRLAIDLIDGEGYNLTFILHWHDGTSSLVKYPVPPDYVGKWIDVAATYDPVTGLAALFWDYRRVATTEVGSRILRTGPDPIRIGRGEDSTVTAAFEGRIDEVRIWGDRPGCHQITTAVEPFEPKPGGMVAISPGASQLSEFCTGDARYAPGEAIQLEAQAAENYVFYGWQGAMEYLGDSEPHKNPVDVTLLASTTVTARFYHADQAPLMTDFPVAGPHNTGFDDTCRPAPCTFGTGGEAKELANDDCHSGGVDIFAPLGTRVVATQGGEVRFRCDDVGGIVAETFYPDHTSWPFAYYYAHLDGACVRNPAGEVATNLCAGVSVCEDWCSDCHDDCGDGDEECHEQCDACCAACTQWEPGTSVYCPHYFEASFVPGLSTYEPVEAGQMLGWVGMSGNAACTSEHLHFGIYRTGWLASCATMNPFPFLYALEGFGFPDWIFGDGFENGDTSAWSTAVP